MSNRADCIKRTKRLKDGSIIEGHAYKAILAIGDRDTDRFYYVLQCHNCEHCSVSYSDEDLESELYPEVQMVGSGEAIQP